MKFLIAVSIISSLAQAQRIPTADMVPMDTSVSKGIYLSLALKQEPVKKPGVEVLQVPGLMSCTKYLFSNPAYRCHLTAGAWQSDEETVKGLFGHYELANKADSKKLFDALGSPAVHRTFEHSGEDNSTLQIYSKTFKTCTNNYDITRMHSLEVTYVQVENYGEFSHDGYFVEVQNFVLTNQDSCP